ncbi:carboxypeptidase-like regulatory domain-containing protein [uncultured Gelidibacter sp.]|uniref:carboxypeptidase-like regulatory domain-containing protein n=1 Tax=uncultured Gelidibacter sp. TaxID=259318 RepID=UPI00261B9888|nr:carboxypeptidase-like regulatory domain-containing protein [uncultured Gelidibacter sp.]
MTKITILFCLFTTLTFSQRISGTLYDAEAPISGAKLMNVTSKSITTTDGSGNFEIYAKLNDTLLFSSLFHHTKQIVVKASHLEGTQVFELKKILNELDEVDIQGPISSKEIDEEVLTSNLNQQFKADLKKNAHLYKKPNTGALDIIAIGESIVKLFKRKNPKEEKIVETTITASHLDTLFKTDPFLNDTFLVLDLNITKDYKHLFFTYCETKDMSSFLLLPANKIYLIDNFLEYSKEFRAILLESQNQ